MLTELTVKMVVINLCFCLQTSMIFFVDLKIVVINLYRPMLADFCDFSLSVLQNSCLTLMMYLFVFICKHYPDGFLTRGMHTELRVKNSGNKDIFLLADFCDFLC